MQYLLFLLVFITGSLTTVVLDKALVAHKARRRNKEWALKARIIREHEASLTGWASIEHQGHGPWCMSSCAHRYNTVGR